MGAPKIHHYTIENTSPKITLLMIENIRALNGAVDKEFIGKIVKNNALTKLRELKGRLGGTTFVKCRAAVFQFVSDIVN